MFSWSRLGKIWTPDTDNFFFLVDRKSVYQARLVPCRLDKFIISFLIGEALIMQDLGAGYNLMILWSFKGGSRHWGGFISFERYRIFSLFLIGLVTSWRLKIRDSLLNFACFLLHNVKIFRVLTLFTLFLFFILKEQRWGCLRFFFYIKGRPRLFRFFVLA